MKIAIDVEGKFKLELRDAKGNLVDTREGNNIWTDAGREFLCEILAFKALSSATTYRDDKVSYIAVGTGAKSTAQGNILSLAAPAYWTTGAYLAPLQSPPTFPISATSTTKTAVQFVREYGLTDISQGGSVILTEAGLFTNGDPQNNFDTATFITNPANFSSSYAPVAYKTFEPITKTNDFTLKIIWEIRFL